MIKRATRKSIRMFCINDPVDAEEYGNLINNPRVSLVHITDNWDQIGNFRMVVAVEEDVDERPLPKSEDDEFDDGE